MRVGLTALATLSAVAACNAIVGNHDRFLIDAEGDGGDTEVPAEDASFPATADGSPADSGTDPGTTDASDAAVGYTGCLGDAGCDRVIFTTSISYKGGDVGGLAGGDAKCQAAADGSANPRLHLHRFHAWLSNVGLPAKDRLVHGTQPYRRVDDAPSDASFDALLTSNPQMPIMTENGVVSTKGAWTGTEMNGTASANTCSDWTSNATTGVTGNPDQPSSWSTDSADDCNKTAALICFED